MEIKTLEELIKEGRVDQDAIPQLPITESVSSVIAVVFSNFLKISQFVKETVAPKLDPELIWSNVLGIGKKEGVALLLRKTTFERHIRPLLS